MGIRERKGKQRKRNGEKDYSVSQNFLHPEKIQWQCTLKKKFPTAENFNQNFARLLYSHIYVKLPNFIKKIFIENSRGVIFLTYTVPYVLNVLYH